MFHFSSLMKVLGKHQIAQSELPILDEEGRVILEPEGILSIKEKKLRSKSIEEYLIKWKNLPEEDASWTTRSFLQ